MHPLRPLVIAQVTPDLIIGHLGLRLHGSETYVIIKNCNTRFGECQHFSPATHEGDGDWTPIRADIRAGTLIPPRSYAFTSSRRALALAFLLSFSTSRP